MTYTSLEQLTGQVRASGRRPRRVCVINATQGHVLEAVRDARRDGLVTPILFGDRDQVREHLGRLGMEPDEYEVRHARSPQEAAAGAGRLLADGGADFLMKGDIPTGTMLKALFDKATGFRTGNLISHLSIIELPGHPKLFGLTDAAINIDPDLKQKKGIIANAVAAMKAMGFDTPKVAALASTESPNPKMRTAMDALELKKAGAAGELGDCVMEGPISYDLAMSPEAARVKQFDSPIQGDADLLFCPDVVSANILIKALRYAGHSRSAGIVVGGRGPIVLTSRSAAATDYYWPLMLAASATLGND